MGRHNFDNDSGGGNGVGRVHAVFGTRAASGRLLVVPGGHELYWEYCRTMVDTNL